MNKTELISLTEKESIVFKQAFEKEAEHIAKKMHVLWAIILIVNMNRCLISF